MTTTKIVDTRVGEFCIPYCSALIFGLTGIIVALLGVAVLVSYSVQNVIILLVISPMGPPMAAVWQPGKLQNLHYVIQDRIYG